MNVFSELAEDSRAQSAFSRYVVNSNPDGSCHRNKSARETYQHNVGSLGSFRQHYLLVFMRYTGIDFINGRIVLTFYEPRVAI